MRDADGGRGVRRRFGRTKDAEQGGEIADLDAEFEAAVHEHDGVRRGHHQLTPGADEPFLAERPPYLPPVTRGRVRRPTPSDPEAVLAPLSQELDEPGLPVVDLADRLAAAAAGYGRQLAS